MNYLELPANKRPWPLIITTGNSDFFVAMKTRVMSLPVVRPLKLENRAATILVAFCTYPMRWFGWFHSRLQDISKDAGGHFFQIVSLLCCFPCFYISDFFFKLAYSLNQRELLRLGAECATLGCQNNLLKLDGLTVQLRHRTKLVQAYREISGSLEASNRALKQNHVGHG